jgi:hypothetical protein
LLYASSGLPPILWFVLGFLAVTVILLTYFLGMDSTLLHVLAVAVLTAGLTFTMFTTILLDQPFGGDTRVSPSAFEIVLTEIGGESQPES